MMFATRGQNLLLILSSRRFVWSQQTCAKLQQVPLPQPCGPARPSLGRPTPAGRGHGAASVNLDPQPTPRSPWALSSVANGAPREVRMAPASWPIASQSKTRRHARPRSYTKLL